MQKKSDSNEPELYKNNQINVVIKTTNELSILREIDVCLEHVEEDFVRSVVANDVADDLRIVLFEHLGGGFLIDVQAVLDDVHVGVVLAAFNLGAVEETSDDGFFVLDVENEDVLHVNDRLDEIDLCNRARNTVEEEGILFRVELVRVHEAFDKAAEDFDSGFVRDEEALAGIRSKELAGFAGRSDATEDVARGEVLESGCSGELCAHSALARTRCTEDKNCRNLRHL